jgi:hypothetical protein
MVHLSAQVIQEKKPEKASPARELEPTAAYRPGDFIGKEGPSKAYGEFFYCGLSIVCCYGCQGTGSCVLVQVLGNRTFQSWTNGKNRTLLEGRSYVLAQLLENKNFPWDPISTGAQQV